MIFPDLPSAHAMAVMAVTLLALVLFTREKIPIESSSLLILISLTVGFELFPYQVDGEFLKAVDFFSGFGHEALVAVSALMIAGHGLVRTGALESIGRVLARLWKVNPSISLLFTLLVSAFVSAFVNNVPVVVLLLPVLISVSLRTGMSASAVLMPMNFATLLGGMSTTIGTSTNLLVVSVAHDMGVRRLEMFDFLLPALIAGSIGILYLWLLAPRLIPKRTLSLADVSPRVFVAHLAIMEESPAVGKTLTQVLEMTDGAMKVVSVERGEGRFMLPLPCLILKSGDHLVIQDTPEQLKEFEKVLKGTLYPDDSEEEPIDENHPLKAEGQQLAEIAVIEGSFLQGATLSGLRFAERFGLIILALHRAGRHLEVVRNKFGEVVLKAGDVLMIQGPRERIAALKCEKEIMVLDATVDLPFTKKAQQSLLIMIGIILTAALGFLPIAISSLCGVLLMVMTGCLRWRDAAHALSTQVVLIVVASLALGAALLKTGGADYLAQLFLVFAGGASPAVVISGLMLLMAIFTNIVSTNASAVIGTPIAVSIATQMGQPAEPFVLAVLFGANMSYATPMAHKTNLLVMSAGEYTFADFVRIGTPLVLMMWVALSLLLPMFYGL